MARIGTAQRRLDRALDHRDRLENLYADPWFLDYARPSAISFVESQLRKDRFYIFTKDQRRVLDEIIEEMTPYSRFGEYSISDLIDIALQCKADCAYPETEIFVDKLAAQRPTELPRPAIKYLRNICSLRVSMPSFSEEIIEPPDRGDEEEQRERAEAACDRLASLPQRRREAA